MGALTVNEVIYPVPPSPSAIFLADSAVPHCSDEVSAPPPERSCYSSYPCFFVTRVGGRRTEEGGPHFCCCCVCCPCSVLRVCFIQASLYSVPSHVQAEEDRLRDV